MSGWGRVPDTNSDYVFDIKPNLQSTHSLTTCDLTSQLLLRLLRVLRPIRRHQPATGLPLPTGRQPARSGAIGWLSR